METDVVSEEFVLKGGTILLEIEIVESIIRAKIPGIFLRVGTRIYIDPEYGETKDIILVWDNSMSTVLRVDIREHRHVYLLVPPILESIYEDLPIRSYLWFDNGGRLIEEHSIYEDEEE